jgi:hypothetical protein
VSFLYQDGSIEGRSGMLEAEVSQADFVFFPLDCVSHCAATIVKRVSRHAGKPYIAWRSSRLIVSPLGAKAGLIDPASYASGQLMRDLVGRYVVLRAAGVAQEALQHAWSAQCART